MKNKETRQKAKKKKKKEKEKQTKKIDQITTEIEKQKKYKSLS